MSVDWDKFWDEFETRANESEYEFQDEMVAKFGDGHYFLSHEEEWERQKKILQDLITKELAR